LTGSAQGRAASPGWQVAQ